MTKKELKGLKPGFKYNKLPKKFKEQWVEGLRQEEWAQCQLRLAVPEVGYCILGTAAKVAEVADQHLFNRASLHGISSETTAGKIINKRVPKELTTNYSLNSYLFSLNDSGKTFPEIAEVINTYL